MTVHAALFREQTANVAVVVVKPHVLSDPTRRGVTQRELQPYFPGYNVVLMSQDARGQANYYGRADIARFLRRVPPARLPMRRYTFN